MGPLNMSLLADLIETKDARIKELEAEVERLKLNLGEEMDRRLKQGHEIEQNMGKRAADYKALESQAWTLMAERDQLRKLCREFYKALEIEMGNLGCRTSFEVLEKADAILGADNV